MLAFVRQVFRPRTVALRPPLRAASWHADTLELGFDGGAIERVSIDVDGVHFGEADLDAAATARFAFPFSPSGHPSFGVMPRAGRDGAVLAERPLRVGIGKSGLDATSGRGAPPLAPLGAAARLVPFGIDIATHEVAVVVPVFNAPALVRRCLDSVLAHSDSRTRLIVIDDASPDPAVTPLLASYAGRERVTVLANPTNRGFTATANRGIDAAGSADVVLLNADAEVAPNWLNGLRRAAYSRTDVGTATAVSDNAGAFSVPELEQATPLPSMWSFDDSARALWQQAGLAYPELPTGNGFCIYIRRAVFDAVGRLDEAAFPQGYGEENDLCQRAAAADFRHLVVGNVLVRHERSQSFGESRRTALGHAGMAVMRERWPQYETDVGRTLFSFERRVLDWRVRRVFAAAHAGEAPPRPRALWMSAAAPPRTSRLDPWRWRWQDGRQAWIAADCRVASGSAASTIAQAHRDCWNGLQRHAIEVLVDDDEDTPVAALCAALGIPRIGAAEALHEKEPKP